ncbi:hypothetical protein D3C75_538490 [compost metagenome]
MVQFGCLLHQLGMASAGNEDDIRRFKRAFKKHKFRNTIERIRHMLFLAYVLNIAVTFFRRDSRDLS